ncbi:hypothetical protein FRACYDRAFT_247013 [Fragilariopsis cylindrus CCMP1102]|uniref:Uncharacterized protein n=1 Tax=Fragilariopsis cylindrus CCMP1102 TaxID=635003 RepID=A0A1E7EX69_9STRA|nr:hypothetical protein FRACYDRAFT_247013 [Fragilariopsis cylindrus CCMP1102]|eukprot:OEU10502.1 hypothetical protein FRACYDRAFT_247013 [Fragilariopsis cylindrus CCMP1102]
MVTINLLDDDAGSDDDDVVVVYRSGTTATATAAAAATDIIDLTSTNTDAAAGVALSRRRRRHNNNNNNDNEIQFIRSINSNNNNNNVVQFVGGGNQNHHRSHLNDYQQLQRQRQQQSQSQSMYTGNRSHPEVVAAAVAATVTVTPARRFPANTTTESAIRLTTASVEFVSGVDGGNLMMNHPEAFGSGRQHAITPLPSSSSSQRNKRKRSSSREKPPPLLPPMEKGRSFIVPTGFDALDMYYPHLKAQERTTVLYQLLPKTQEATSFTKKSVHDWRVQYEKTNSSKQTLWSMVSSFSDYIISSTTTDINHGKSKTITVVDEGNHIVEDRKMPAKPKMTLKKKKKKGSKGRCNDIISLIWNNNEEGGNVEEKKKLVSTTVSSSASGSSGGHSGAGDIDIGPLNSDVIDTLHTYFRAYVTRKRHKCILDNIEPIDVDDNNNNNGNVDSAITCSICSDDFDLSNTVPCSSEKTIHFFCKSCF